MSWENCLCETVQYIGYHVLSNNMMTNKFAPISELDMSQKIVGILGGRELETYKALDSS